MSTMTSGRSPRTAYLGCFVALGISLSMVGPAMTHLRDRAGVGLGAGGLIVAGQGVGYVVASLVTGHRIDRHGAGHDLLVAVVATLAVAGVVLPLAAPLWAVVAVFTVIGAAGGSMDVLCNTLLVWHEPPDRVGTALNGLHLRFGIGAIVAPLVVAASLRATDELWLVSLTLTAAAVAIGLWLRGVPTPQKLAAPDPTAAPSPPPDAAPSGAGASADAPTPPHTPGLLVLGGLFFALYVGAEGTFGAWSTTYGEALDLGWADAAAVLTAVYWGGFTLGRVAAVAATRRRSVDRVLVVSCVAATAGAIVLALVDAHAPATWAMVAILGFALGPQYATMLAVVDRRVGLDGRSASTLIGAAGTGGLVVPLATGWILQQAEVTALPVVVAVTIAGATAFAALVVARHPAAPRVVVATR